MNRCDDDPRGADSYCVFLLRLWRENNGPWHAVLQSADAVAPQRFADLDALAEYLRAAAFTSIAPRGSDSGETD